MDKRFWLVLVIIVLIFGSSVFTQVSFILPGILRLNIIIMGLLALFLLLGYGYIPTTQTGQKIKLYFFLIVLSILIGVQIYSSLPTFLSDTEKEYIEHLDKGYSFYQNSKYDEALNQYEIAENIYKEDSRLYIYKAYCYQYKKEYAKAIENAQEALKYPDSKSIYKKAHNYKLISLDDDFAAYAIIGECSLAQGRYKKAKEAYSYTIEHTTYKYTDAYLYRGICEYYLYEKQTALEDFKKHKLIVNTYISDQENSDYKSKYPKYTKKDLIIVNEWIRAANKL